VVNFDEGADDTQRSESEILKGPALAHGVQEWVQEEGDVCLEEEWAGVLVRSDALKEGQDVAGLIGCLAIEQGR